MITAYNSKSYQVDGLTYDFNPMTYKFMDNKAKTTRSMHEYMYKAHGVNLREKQPLLFVNRGTEKIYLPVTECFEASLPPDFTKDSRKMRDIHHLKVTYPGVRKDKIDNMAQRFMTDSVFQKWGVELDSNMMQIQANILPEAKILDNSNNPRSFNDYVFRNVKTREPMRLTNQRWAFVYHTRDFDLATKIIENMSKNAGGLGMQVDFKIGSSEPIYIEVPDDGNIPIDRNKLRDGGNYLYCLKEELTIIPSKPEVIFVLLQRDSHKANIKRWLDEQGLVS